MFIADLVDKLFNTKMPESDTIINPSTYVFKRFRTQNIITVVKT
jgi:hypothetical protein